jgi:hypothetical protein
VPPGVNNRCFLILNFLVWSVIAPFAEASLPDGNGSVSGRVLDSRGGVIQQVTITLRNQETGLEQSLDTDPWGTFQFELGPII